MADKLTGALRAALGQGLGMGLGDEGEAWLRSKLGDDDYKTNLQRIRSEYKQFSDENPWTSGGLEFGGGMIPGVVAMLIPGGQGAGAAQIARSTGQTMARMGALGALSGAVSGAGNATEGNRLSGAISGGVMGGTMGAAMPLATKGLTASGRWLRERLPERFGASDAYITERAAGKLNQALERGNQTPIDIQRQLIADKRLGVPSVVANTSKPVSSLTEVVAQRAGKGANQIEEGLEAQMLGARERITEQVQKRISQGNYYDDLENLERQMAERAGPAYQQAYSYGEVKNPKVLEFLELPQFKKAAGEVQEMLAAEGKKADLTKPTVENLDHIKRGLDALIDKETDSMTGKVSALGRVYIQKKNEFLNALDATVPDYELARGIYSGGAQLRDAMNAGLKDFNKSNSKEIEKAVARMQPEERAAYRTGVVQHLYGVINNSANQGNKAKNIIGSPETQLKLQALFDDPAQYKLFEAAMQREAQLHQQAGKILSGSPTARRAQMAAEFDGDNEVGQALAQSLSGGIKNSLVNSAMRAINGNAQLSGKTADKLADWLMESDPSKVAAVVTLLEEASKKGAPRALKSGAVQGGILTGTTSAAWPTTLPEDESEER